MIGQLKWRGTCCFLLFMYLSSSHIFSCPHCIRNNNQIHDIELSVHAALRRYERDYPETTHLLVIIVHYYHNIRPYINWILFIMLHINFMGICNTSHNLVFYLNWSETEGKKKSKRENEKINKLGWKQNPHPTREERPSFEPYVFYFNKRHYHKTILSMSMAV